MNALSYDPWAGSQIIKHVIKYCQVRHFVAAEYGMYIYISAYLANIYSTMHTKYIILQIENLDKNKLHAQDFRLP